MSKGEVIPLYEAWRYKTLSVVGADATGIAIHERSFLLVPFPHIIRAAFWGHKSYTKAGANDVVSLLRYKMDGTAGSLVSDLQTLTASEAGPKYRKFALTSTVKNEIAVAAYALQLNLDNAGDSIVQPQLAIMVSPIPPGPA